LLQNYSVMKQLVNLHKTRCNYSAQFSSMLNYSVGKFNCETSVDRQSIVSYFSSSQFNVK